MSIEIKIQSETGTISVSNPSAWFIPEFTLSRKIGGTVYRVSGTYEGTELLSGKMKRILTREMEDSA